MSPLFGGSSDEESDRDKKRCTNCGRLKDVDDFWNDEVCNSCGKSAWTQKCPRCDSTSITSETKDNPKGYETHAPGTITIWECNECGFRSGFRHDWKWE